MTDEPQADVFVLIDGQRIPIGNLVKADFIALADAEPLHEVPVEAARSVAVSFSLDGGQVRSLRKFMTNWCRLQTLRRQLRLKGRPGWKQIR